MKPTIQLATSTTPSGQPMVLSQHDRDFYITIDQYTLMTSREQESELELARLGCGNLPGRRKPQVLIGGLGMGFTLRQTLDLLPEKAKVTVAELVADVVAWNRTFLGPLTGHPLQDPRVVIKNRDVRQVICGAKDKYDAILLDTDNGPSAMTVAENAALYEPAGLHVIMCALKPDGCLAIWSVSGDVSFAKMLRREKLAYRQVRVQAFKSARSRSRTIWLIARDRQSLPPA